MQLDKKRTKGGSVMRGLGAALLLMLPVMVFGQDAAAAPVPANKGDVSWLMTSTVLVILMTIPGLALFYGGMVRSKNVLSLLMQVMIIFCVGVLMFAIYGYSMAFSEGTNQFVGGFGKIFLKGMTGDSLTGTFSKATNIPELGFFCFQATFAAITPALIVGAFAERIKFSALLVFIIIWLTFAYYPIAHMVWFWAGPDAYVSQAASDAAVAHNGFLFNKGALDFAGGTVVHINAGIAGLVGCLLIGKRVGYGTTALPPHNLPYVMVGSALLWVGWFGFNVGSNLEANGFATLVFTNTLLATAAATLAWMLGEWIIKGSPTMLGAASGAVAGLVAITPACGWVGPMGAIAIGGTAGVACFFATSWMKRSLRIDDSLDVTPVHGVGGIIGTLLTGIFAAASLGGVGYPENGTMGGQFTTQLVGVLAVGAWSGIVTWIVLKLTQAMTGMRVSPDEETEGLDTVEHNEKGYNL